jgi:hypothetical protein
MNSLKVPAPLLTRGIWPWLLAVLLLGQAQAQTPATPGNAPATPPAANSPAPSAAVAPTSDPGTQPPGTDPISAAPAPTSVPAAPAAPAPVATRKPIAPRDTRPTWSELSHKQREALKPLADAWPSLNELHKRKWLVLSQNFAELSPQEQHKLQQRMSEWANLTARERAQARLHFAEVRQLPDDERRAKWEAYQALSDEQRRKLADDILLEPPRGAAVASRPVASSKLTQPPAAKPDQVLQPRIDTDQIHPKTLLPHFLQGTSTR